MSQSAIVVTCQQHSGRHEPGDDCVTPYIATDPAEPTELTWEDVYAAIGREVWKLAPQDHQDSGHKDITFLTCWQNIMEAVENGIEAVAALPDDCELVAREGVGVMCIRADHDHAKALP